MPKLRRSPRKRGRAHSWYGTSGSLPASRPTPRLSGQGRQHRHGGRTGGPRPPRSPGPRDTQGPRLPLIGRVNRGHRHQIDIRNGRTRARRVPPSTTQGSHQSDKRWATFWSGRRARAAATRPRTADGREKSCQSRNKEMTPWKSPRPCAVCLILGELAFAG